MCLHIKETVITISTRIINGKFHFSEGIDKLLTFSILKY